MTKDYLKIVKHYEDCLGKHGDTPLGVDWPNQKDQFKRYRVMLDLIKDPSQKCRFLDFGCGTAALYDYIISKNEKNIQYSGLEISSKFAEVAKKKHSHLNIYELDILSGADVLPEFDYIVMNGVFTEKRELAYDDMYSYFKKVIIEVFKKAKVGLAFNLMSKNVDWEREDLFHVSKDVLESFLSNEVTRNIIFRADYGLFEYTVYLYKESYE